MAKPIGIHPDRSDPPRFCDEYLVLTLQALWPNAEKGDCRAHAGRCRAESASRNIRGKGGIPGFPVGLVVILLFHGAWKFVFFMSLGF